MLGMPRTNRMFSRSRSMPWLIRLVPEIEASRLWGALGSDSRSTRRITSLISGSGVWPFRRTDSNGGWPSRPARSAQACTRSAWVLRLQ